MGSVMDRERPWEKKERIEGYWTFPMARLKDIVEDLKRTPWDYVEYGEAKEVLEAREKRGDV